MALFANPPVDALPLLCTYYCIPLVGYVIEYMRWQCWIRLAGIGRCNGVGPTELSSTTSRMFAIPSFVSISKH